MFSFNKKSFKRFDFILLISVILLTLLGLLLVKSATINTGSNDLVKSQTMAMVLGLIMVLVLSLIDYHFLGKLYIPIYIVCNLILIVVAIWGFGEDEWGARSWLEIGPVIFQPSEFVKVGIIISLAKFIDNHKESINEPFTLLKILLFVSPPILLILKQPDAGTAIVIVFFIALMMFTAGLRPRYIGYAVFCALAALPVLWFKLDNYQKNRFFDFLEPERNMAGSGYQVVQSKIAIGSGKIFGRGLFKGVQTQLNFIPEKQTDFIFPVLVEELGFLGGMALILLYFVFLHRLVKIARNTEDVFGSTMVVGITGMFLFHIWENLAMTMGMMPVTGIPLPFISHGGTFLVINMICIGIVLSVGMHREGLNF
ncbi:rod shape-determining protein RodA [Tissierella creatinophila]|uniref:Peptidoglycan glycosyltransferase RodA n=1 Tax=Tissierella creatinophila DSM 6911 TaxID=1123403 RepID=A0A1U7M953_TISCR|nr:rod shape-determining protein RodA [Tissierella creatinophila]OLS03864.1 Rod shape-determining protein RodA [Tissierella creatinophila DSM 6911]